MREELRVGNELLVYRYIEYQFAGTAKQRWDKELKISREGQGWSAGETQLKTDATEGARCEPRSSQGGGWEREGQRASTI